MGHYLTDLRVKVIRRFALFVLPIMCLVAFNLNPEFSLAADGPQPAAALNNPANAVSSEGKIFSTQLQTAAALPQVTSASSLLLGALGPVNNGPGTRSVIGTDQRTRVNNTTTYPYRAIVHISSSIGGCTGWLIGPRTVVTAGHCVYEKPGGWAKNVVVTPGKNGSTNPYGTTTGHRLFSVLGWTNNTDTNYDYGAIELDSPLGNTVGWFGYRWTSASLQNTFVNITGYPGDKTYGTMWTASGSVNNGTYKLTYTIDTYAGQSGSPVYQSYYAGCGVCAIAIHTNGGSTSNSGTRITQSVFNNLNFWKGYAYP